MTKPWIRYGIILRPSWFVVR